jgi:cytochrome P450
VQAVLRDRRAEARIVVGLESQGVTDGPLYDSLNTSLLNMNGEEHLRLRALVLKAFTPSAVDRFRPAMRELATEVTAPLIAAGRMDVMEDLANHYPVQVICTVLGVPRHDHDAFRHWLDTSSFALSMEAGVRQREIIEANTHLAEYCRTIVADRKRDPADDLVSAMLQAVEGDDRLTEDEVVRMTTGLLFAGHDTTRNQIGRTMIAFAEHPEQWEAMAADPSLVPRAVDEALRFTPVIDGVSPRVVSEDLVVGDLSLPSGTHVSACTYAANIDPAAHGADAGSFDIAARRGGHLTFGGGAHLCIGMSLAKAEMVELLAYLAAHITNLRLDGSAVWPPAVGIWGPTSVPLAFDRR